MTPLYTRVSSFAIEVRGFSKISPHFSEYEPCLVELKLVAGEVAVMLFIANNHYFVGKNSSLVTASNPR